ncbi:MAG TPA: STAS/SEC14 domain-containing protein [Polyangiaceae bacterium]|nr:STAS/SEC14 domain-containing protein [Polyangiaceae bacterium]
MSNIATVQLRGNLTALVLESALSAVDSSATAVLVDALEMTDYDAEARTAFVAWNERTRDRIQRVAVVTEKPLWRMVISAMGVASRQKMRAFASTSDARDWLSVTP